MVAFTQSRLLKSTAGLTTLLQASPDIQTFLVQQVATAQTAPSPQSASDTQSASAEQGVCPSKQKLIPPELLAHMQDPPGPHGPNVSQLTELGHAREAQTPLLQIPLSHTLLQAPQLLGSVAMSMHAPLHVADGSGQLGVELVVVWPMKLAQALPVNRRGTYGCCSRSHSSSRRRRRRRRSLWVWLSVSGSI